MGEAQAEGFAEALAAFAAQALNPAELLAMLPTLQLWRNQFLQEFGAERLEEQSGAELLERLPLGGAEDSLCAWLRLRQGPTFDTRVFGDLGGADPRELGVWRATAGGPWLVPGPAGAQEVDEDQAVRVVLALRAELVGAVKALRAQAALPVERGDGAALQQALAQAAPRLVGSAWLHKYLHLHHPERVTRAATAAALDAHLRRLGLPPGGRGLYDRDLRIVQCWSRVPALQRLPPLLRYRVGEPPLAARLEAHLQGAGLLPGERARVVSGGGARRRDVTSVEAQEAIGRRLAQVAGRFFAPQEGAEAAAVETRWEAALLLREDRLLLMVGPLPGLPRFVRELELQAGAARQRVLAANLRAQRFAVAVPPCAEGYRFAAVDFGEELAAELAPLEVPGLSLQRATALRLGVMGEGQVLAGAVLAPGHSYALLVPPTLGEVPLAEALALPSGWRLWQVEEPMLEAQRELLGRLGLQVAPVGVALRWALAAPRCYGEGRQGERYACFLVGDDPVVEVSRGGATGALALFLHGPEGLLRRVLGPAERLLVLAELPEGRYLLELVPEDGEAELWRLPFAVLAEVPEGPRCEARLRIGTEALVVDEETAWEGDLTRLGVAPEVELWAPPLWPVRTRWRGARPLRGGTLQADEEGRVALAPLLKATEAERQRRRVGDVRMDLGELGQVQLRHRRAADEEDLAERLTALWRERGALVAEAAGQLALLRGAWLEPVCEVLGYALRALRQGEGPAVPPGLGVALLEAPLCGEAGWTLRPAAGLIVAADPLAQGPRGFGLVLCRALGLRRVVLTDGLRFALFAPELTFLPQWRLDRALEDRESGAFQSFLALLLAEAQP